MHKLFQINSWNCPANTSLDEGRSLLPCVKFRISFQRTATGYIKGCSAEISMSRETHHDTPPCCTWSVFKNRILVELLA